MSRAYAAVRRSGAVHGPCRDGAPRPFQANAATTSGTPLAASAPTIDASRARASPLSPDSSRAASRRKVTTASQRSAGTVPRTQATAITTATVPSAPANNPGSFLRAAPLVNSSTAATTNTSTRLCLTMAPTAPAAPAPTLNRNPLT